MYWFYFVLLVVLKAAVILGVLVAIVPGLVLMERKVLGRIQLRPGPIHVGPWGTLQTVADGIKMLMKEDITPRDSFRPIFWLAPGLVAVTALFSFSVIPFADWSVTVSELHEGLSDFPLGYITDLDLAVLFVLAMSSLSVYGVAWGGWAGGSKYGLLGGLRSAAQMISYELTLGLTLLTMVVVTGTLSFVEIVAFQSRYGWAVFYQPVTMCLFVVAVFAETNRLPFDLPEAEQELTGGYHTEHSSMKFGLFFLGEYLHMLVGSSLWTLLFLGGWLPPFPTLAFWDIVREVPVVGTLMPLVWFGLKVGFFLFLFMWVRGTFPRLRYDRLMKLGWMVLLEIGFVNLLIAGLMRALWPQPVASWYVVQGLFFLLFLVLVQLLKPTRFREPRTVTLES